MTLKYLEIMERRETVTDHSEAMLFSIQMTQRALEITARLNGSFHPMEEVQEIFSELTGQDIRGRLYLFPPFHTDFGQNIRLEGTVTINAGVTIQDHGGVVIGEGTLIGPHVVLATGNHDLDPARRRNLHPAPIRIGKNVWVGANATILQGVTIGDGAVVAAGAVVNRDVPENTVVGGVLAKIIKTIESTDAS